LQKSITRRCRLEALESRCLLHAMPLGAEPAAAIHGWLDAPAEPAEAATDSVEQSNAATATVFFLPDRLLSSRVSLSTEPFVQPATAPDFVSVWALLRTDDYVPYRGGEFMRTVETPQPTSPDLPGGERTLLADLADAWQWFADRLQAENWGLDAEDAGITPLIAEPTEEAAELPALLSGDWFDAEWLIAMRGDRRSNPPAAKQPAAVVAPEGAAASEPGEMPAEEVSAPADLPEEAP
jgi:hypothetical protein